MPARRVQESTVYTLEMERNDECLYYYRDLTEVGSQQHTAEVSLARPSDKNITLSN